MDRRNKEIQKRCGKEKITRVFRDKDRLALADDGFLRQGCVLLLDLASGQETILKTLEDWYFEDDNLYINVSDSSSQPVMNCYRETEAGVYECFSTVYNCERITKGKAYVLPGIEKELYCYPHRGLDEMISMAKEILDGRELTPIERQRYSIEQ